MVNCWEHDDRAPTVASTPDQKSLVESDQNASPATSDSAAVQRRGRGRFSELNDHTLYCEALPPAPRETPRRNTDPAGAAARLTRSAFAGLGLAHPLSTPKKNFTQKETSTPKREEAPPKPLKNLVKKTVTVLPVMAKEAKPDETSSRSKNRRRRQAGDEKAMTRDDSNSRSRKGKKNAHLPAVEQKETKTAAEANNGHKMLTKTIANTPAVEQKEAKSFVGKHHENLPTLTVTRQNKDAKSFVAKRHEMLPTFTRHDKVANSFVAKQHANLPTFSATRHDMVANTFIAKQPVQLLTFTATRHDMDAQSFVAKQREKLPTFTRQDKVANTFTAMQHANLPTFSATRQDKVAMPFVAKKTEQKEEAVAVTFVPPAVEQKGYQSLFGTTTTTTANGADLGKAAKETVASLAPAVDEKKVKESVPETAASVCASEAKTTVTSGWGSSIMARLNQRSQ